MDYSAEMMIWDSTIIKIINMKHGLLIGQEITVLYENSAFIYAIGNSGNITLDGKTYPIKSNCLLHIGPDHPVTVCAENEEIEYYIVVYQADLPPDAGRMLLRESLQINPFQKTYLLQIAKPLSLSAQLVSMVNEWHEKTPLAQLRIKQSFYAIVCSMYLELTSGQSGSMTFDQFDYIYRYLQQNYDQNISIQALADSLGMARSTIHKLFKDKIGLSPQQFLMQLRLDAVCRLLENSQATIDEIAAQAGLRDKSYLTRVFKEKYGITPGAYRKAHITKKTQSAQNVRIPPQIKNENDEYISIENMGRIHRYFEVPKRIVCLDYAAAEICVALGAADKITGVTSAEESLADCAKEFRSEIAKAPFLHAHSPELNVPDFRSVCDCHPDLVIGTGYSFNRYGGVADAEEFEAKGIHIYAMNATYTLGCDYESVYEDIRNLGKILGAEEQAERLVQKMIQEESVLNNMVTPQAAPVRVFVFDSSISDKALTCGKSLENHMICSAGGTNIFEDRQGQFVVVGWDEVAKANPRIILVHSFNSKKDGLQKANLLKQIPEIAETDAVINNRIHIIGIKKVFPALDNLETAQCLASMFRNI